MVFFYFRYFVYNTPLKFCEPYRATPLGVRANMYMSSLLRTRLHLFTLDGLVSPFLQWLVVESSSAASSMSAVPAVAVVVVVAAVVAADLSSGLSYS